MHQPSPRPLELLAPARDCEIARLAIIHGADAVYIGANAFGARSAATNSTDDIARLVYFAHTFNARVYVTLNTILYDEDIPRARNIIYKLYRAGVDALIVQDMALLRMDLPPIALHASTQCDTRTLAKTRFLEDCGFSQIVLARELSLQQIKEIALGVSVPLEAFVHGALCVSYSGDCQASFIATGRSSNRGECAQMCRLSYSLTDENGQKVAPDGHYLSLRDMNRLDRLADMADAGISSFKIEGRLKDATYVRTTVAAYSQALNKIVERSDGRYCRPSTGDVDYRFRADVNEVFNRRFTTYFLDGRPSDNISMASIKTPKWTGKVVATVVGSNDKAIRIKSNAELHNGDGLGYFDREGQYRGFRLNRVDGQYIFPATKINLPIGTPLYRNRNKELDDSLSGSTASRTIGLTAILRRINDSTIALRFNDPQGVYGEATCHAEYQKARTPQTERRLADISRLGDTVYRIIHLDDCLADDEFIAASVLSDLRRQTIKVLEDTRRCRYHFDYRRKEMVDIKPFKDAPLDRHDNVANALARKFYTDHGIEVSEPAIEVKRPKADELRVMTTRYCLRRELGACLKTKDGRNLPSPLYLRTATGINYRLDFDCPNCSMHLIAIFKK